MEYREHCTVFFIKTTVRSSIRKNPQRNSIDFINSITNIYRNQVPILFFFILFHPSPKKLIVSAILHAFPPYSEKFSAVKYNWGLQFSPSSATIDAPFLFTFHFPFCCSFLHGIDRHSSPRQTLQINSRRCFL